ncbi:MAG: hypothetical protein IPF68_03570 [Bacteroidales bacterium]|nr:hypothetical protein [Bacteroidales bacterium]
MPFITLMRFGSATDYCSLFNQKEYIYPPGTSYVTAHYNAYWNGNKA